MFCFEINYNFLFEQEKRTNIARQLTGSFSISVSLIVTDNFAFAGLRSRFIDFGSARLDFLLQTLHKFVATSGRMSDSVIDATKHFSVVLLSY